MLIFFIFRAEAYTCWSARFARSRVGGVARLFKEISFFFGFKYFFHFSSIFRFLGHLWLFIMNRRLFIMKKDRFWPIYRISVFRVICGFLS